MDNNSPGWGMLNALLSDLRTDTKEALKSIETLHGDLSRALIRISELEKSRADYKELAELKKDIKKLDVLTKKNKYYLLIISGFVTTIATGVWGLEKVMDWFFKVLKVFL